MHNFFRTAAVWAVALALVACGGGDALDGSTTSSTGTSTGSTGSSGSTGNTGTTSTAAKVVVTSSVATIPADGSSTATITATVTNSSGAAVSGATVSFTSTGGTVTTVSGTTNSSGVATATLSTGSAAAGSTITVTATSGSVSNQVAVGVGTTQQTLVLQTSSPQIPSDGSKAATITALVRDSKNNFVPNVAVQFSATSGGVTPTLPTGDTTGTAGTTDDSGAAEALLSTAGDPTNRGITVTATVGTVSTTIVVSVVGSSLSVSGPASLVQGAQGSYSVSLVDSAKNAIPGKTITVKSSAGNSLSSGSLTTDQSGNAAFTMTATHSGSDTITVSGLSLSSTESVSVSNQAFGFSAPATNAVINLNTATSVVVNWKSSGNPVSGQTVNFASTRGTLSASSATTDQSGNATVSISSTSSGPAIISATATGVTATQNVSFVATTPSSISVQPSPSTVTINGQSTIQAIVKDANNNLVQGKTVNFTLSDSTGGSLSAATATTDSEGAATVIYTAGSTPSTSNGVSITGTVQGYSSVSQTATLTVGGQTVFISLGTGNHISENASQTQFLMPWTVSAVDSGGNPVNNVSISLTVHSSSRPYDAYLKGHYIFCGVSWVTAAGSDLSACSSSNPDAPAVIPVGCLNEDVNLTGVYEASEDTNNNGRLDPGDVATATPGTVTTTTNTTTGENGAADFTVQYPEDHANWVQVTLTATATVQGTQTTTSATFLLPMLNTYLTTSSSTPPGAVSPYGEASSCTDPN